MTSFPAAIHGEGFGLGATELAAGETELILFLLALLGGVLLVTGLFIYLGWRQARHPALPPETNELLDELSQTPGRTTSPPSPEPTGLAPWEKPADWWKSHG